MTADDESRLLDALGAWVGWWTALQGHDAPPGPVAVSPASPTSPTPSDDPGRVPAAHSGAPAALAPAAGETVATLQAMGYLEPDAGGQGLAPTAEALCLTDPWLCEELASSLRAAFHARFLHVRAGRLS